MKRSCPRIARAACAIATAALTASAFAQSAPPPASSGSDSQEMVKLPSFTVSAEKADAYRSQDVTSVARIAGSILDSPLSVNVVTPELIADVGANATFDVTHYFSGMSPGRGTGPGGIMDRQDFRGFESFSKTIDNFSSFLIPTGQGFQANFDPVFVDRAELVMGPDSILSPTGTPGGSVNIITKSPKFNAENLLSVEVGTYNAGKISVDSTGPVNGSDKLAFRVIADYQDAKTYVPGSIREKGASAQLLYKISPTSSLTLKYFGEQWGLTGAIANPNGNGEIVTSPDTVAGAELSNNPQPGFLYNGWNANAAWSHRWDRLNIGTAELTTALSDRINMRVAGSILFDNFSQDSASPSVSPAETFDPNTGVEIAVAALNPSAVPMVATINHAINRDIQFQHDFAGNFEAGGVSLQPVLGWAYQQGEQPVEYQIQDKSTADFPLANVAAYYAPVHPPLANYTSFSANTPENGWLYQAYGLVKAGFWGNRIYVTAGASRTWANVNDYVFPGIQLPGTGLIGAAGPAADNTFSHTGLAASPSVKSSHDNYLGGLLYKLTKGVSLYGSFSTNEGIAQNNPLWQSGKQYEFGVKSEWFHQRLTVSAAHFQIEQSNVSAVNPLFNTGQSTIPTILLNESNRGYELNVVGGITRELSVIASYTTMHLRDPFGRRIRNIPDEMSNLLLNYHFTEAPLKNLSLFAGVQQVGNTAGETVTKFAANTGVPDQVGFYVQPWTVVNAGAGYAWGRYHFNLNVDNVLNSQFWWQPAGRQSVSQYPGLTTRLTTTVKF